MTPATWYQWEGDTLILRLRIQPKASRDGFAELMDGQRKLRITAPPVDGKANSHLIAYLAKRFGVAKGAVEIIGGETGRQKRIRIRAPQKLAEGIVPATP